MLVILEYVGLATGFILLALFITWPIIGRYLPGAKRYQKTRKVRRWHVWAVVQDLRPFGYNVESLHTFKVSAKYSCLNCQYLTVVRASAVISENQRLSDPEEVMRDLEKGFM